MFCCQSRIVWSKSIHAFLGVLSIATGLYSLLRYGFFDECRVKGHDERVLVWDIHNDMSDIALGLLLLGFINLGVVVGVWHSKSSNSVEQHKMSLSTIFGAFGMYFLIKILLLCESDEAAWRSPCFETREQWWTLFYAGLFTSLISMTVPWFSGTPDDGSSDANANDTVTEPLITGEEGEGGMKAEFAWKRKYSACEAIGRLLSEACPDLHIIILAFLALFIAAGSDLFNPWFIGKIINDIVVNQDAESFKQNIFIIILVTISTGIATGCRSGLFTLVMARMTLRLRTKLFRQVIKQETSFFDSVRTGDITNRFSADCSKMVDTLSLNINVFLRSMVTIFGSIVLMVKLSWELSLLTIIGLPFGFILGRYYGHMWRVLQEKIQDTLADAGSCAEEAFGNIRTVRSFANEDGEAVVYEEKCKLVYSWMRTKAWYMGGYMSGNILISNGLAAATLWYGGHLILEDRISGDTLIPFVLYQLSLGNAIGSVGAVYTGLMEAVGSAERVFQLMDRQAAIDITEGGHAPAKIEGHIEFKNVKFSYPTRPKQPVLQGLTFTAPKGKVTALVGASGGGKSSIVSLITRLYEKNDGEILLDGVDVRKYTHESLHRLVTVVQQEPVLFARSIQQNIMYGPFEVDDVDDAIEKSTKMASAHEFIVNMADKFDTQCGEKGQQLSGGQKQRIAIARSLVRKPCVLILDEATSALDAASEKIVQSALDRIQQEANMTIILIAHRLSTVKNADQIVVINEGNVVETGSHDELMTKNNHYARLVAAQVSEGSQSSPQKTVIKEKVVYKRVVTNSSSQKDYDISPGTSA